MTDQAQALREMAKTKGKDPARIITVTSGKGGVGKSSLALNMAISLSRMGRRPLIVDSDFGFSNIDVMLGVSTRFDLTDVLEKRVDMRGIIEQGLERVQFISGGSGVYELTKLSGDQIGEIAEELTALEDVADTIIFDTGAGVSDAILRLVCASQQTVIVTTPEPTAVVDAYAMIKIISERVENPAVSLVVNKAANPREALSVMNGIISITKKNLGLSVGSLGFILSDDSMKKAIKMQVPLLVSFPQSAASLNIDEIAGRFLRRSAEHKARGVLRFLNRLADTRDA